jgi:hypothetical protein
LPDSFEQAQGENAAPRGVHDEIGGQRFVVPIAILIADASHCCAIRRRDKLANAAALAEGDVRMLLHALPHHALDQRAGHRVNVPAQIARRQGIEPR